MGGILIGGMVRWVLRWGGGYIGEEVVEKVMNEREKRGGGVGLKCLEVGDSLVVKKDCWLVEKRDRLKRVGKKEEKSGVGCRGVEKRERLGDRVE